MILGDGSMSTSADWRREFHIVMVRSHLAIKQPLEVLSHVILASVITNSRSFI